MGYDVTYHPITREEINEWYFEPLRDNTAIDRLAEKYGFLAENYRHVMQSVEKHITEASENKNASFEQVHGLMIATVQGLMRRYDYFRGSLMTNLVTEDDRFLKYVQSFAEFVPDQYKKMRFANGIEENWCGGVYIPPEAVKVLIYDTENDSFVKNAMLKNFGDQEELDRFLNLLHYAEENQFGVLEATEVVIPIRNQGMSDLGNCELGFMERVTISPYLTTPHNFVAENIAENKEDDFENENTSSFVQEDDVTPSPEELEKKRVWRKWLMRFLAMCLGLFSLVYFGLGFMEYFQSSFGQKILKEGIAIEASIEQHFYVEKEGYFLEYKFSDGNQEYKRTAKLRKSAWNQLEGKKTVSIRVLPDSLENSRVEVGDINLRFMWGFFGGGLFFFIIFIFTFLGYSIEQRNGVYYLLKHGQIVEDRIAELAEKEKNKNRNN
ncbi:MAG: hypothetical protein LBL62_07515 [Planctomycetaceae bacterium]|jgi:hypothetical protein|nr:hypothetical protein [Planctomycetaceae bacterium]